MLRECHPQRIGKEHAPLTRQGNTPRPLLGQKGKFIHAASGKPPRLARVKNEQKMRTDGNEADKPVTWFQAAQKIASPTSALQNLQHVGRKMHYDAKGS